jgi:soluble lytic murein transglycosylase-like protein
MYYLIEKYSEKYKVPRNYAYGIAYCETHYKEPFQWDYTHKQTSCVGAVGPMQIMYTTAQMMWPGKKFTKEFLKDNIEFNIETSMKLLHHLHNRYGDWKTVFGCYNTGRPMINQYALNVYNYKPNF